jgi:hypothetical protein
MDVLSIYLSLKTTHGCFLLFPYAWRENMDVCSCHLLKSEDNTWMFFPIHLSLKTTHLFSISIYLSLKKTHRYCISHLLKPEDNTWMFFLLFTEACRQHMNVFFFPFNEVWRQHMNICFSIFLCLKTTYEYFFPFT